MIAYHFTNKIKKILSKGLKSKGGRNFLGRVCIRGQGGGNKRNYRFIDFYRRLNLKGKVINILYDPNRSARIVLVVYYNSLCSFLLLQKNVKLNTVIYSGTLLCEDEIIHEGFSMPLKHMPLFSNISNIELKPFIGSTLCRAAGTSCMLVGKVKTKGVLKLNSN
jgi:large subunit ribosomal protein L2